MAADGWRHRVHSSTSLPRSINVSKFAESRGSELDALHSIVLNRTESNFRIKRKNRRRTTSHENQASRRRKKNKRVEPSCIDDNRSGEEVMTKLSRRKRRRLEFKNNAVSGFATSGDGTKRLRTHIWHAKRFTMAKMWGFYLPLGLHGSGRGSRAVLKQLRNSAVIHDSSYSSAILLEGSQESLLQVLEIVLLPSHSALPEDRSALICSGAAYGVAMLYHTASSTLPAIAPITYMWRPCSEVGDTKANSLTLQGPEHEHTGNSSTIRRQIWVWLHPAAFKEGYNALSGACQKICGSGQVVNCSSLEGKLARLELLGEKACQILHKIIHPISPSMKRTLDMRCSSQSDCVESLNSVSYLTAMDPRTVARTSIPHGSASNGVEHFDCDAFPVNTQRDKVIPLSSTPEESERFYDTSLWDLDQQKVPVGDNVLCSMANSKRMNSLFIEESKQQPQRNCHEIQDSESCPILLLKNNSPINPLPRWTVILPLSWTKVFWISFICNGCHAIGLREKQWIGCELGLPCFPLDFPDCIQNTEHESPAEWSIVSPWSAVYHSMAQSKLENIAYKSKDDFTCSFPGFVARTLPVLTTFLTDMNRQYGQICSSQDTLPSNHQLCFTRVLLHAFKEGVFDKGAVVCAPSLCDISSLTSSSSEGLQIPHKSLNCWFTADHSGNWKYLFPDCSDHAAMEFHRCPIGFVTTGFVRGSKKPVAEALCDVVLLSRLRVEQQKDVDSKIDQKQIHVLVRNMRSTAFRLALATFVLEIYQDDILFI